MIFNLPLSESGFYYLIDYMPLEATHIRFALDLQNKYQIKDIQQYISGAIYPDSRYITGIDRNLTHDDKFLLPEFAQDDFHKGWQTHRICDLVYNIIVKTRLFIDLFPVSYNSYNEPEWVTLTALKIIQDMDDMQSFNIQQYLPYLDYPPNPNQEQIEEIKKYNQLMIDLYKDKKITTVNDNINMWLALGIETRLGNVLRAKVADFLKDPKMVMRIKAVYKEMLDCYPEIVNQRILDKFGANLD